MKQYRALLSMVSLVFLVTFWPVISTLAAEGLLFPQPKGKYYIPRAYGPNETHDRYELDFQAGETPAEVKKEPRCFTYGMPVLATKAGVIDRIRPHSGRWESGSKSLGTYVTIKHDDGTYSLYGHLIDGSPEEYAKVGDRVEARQIIGLMGDTGDVTGPRDNAGKPLRCRITSAWGTHLHFGLYDRDPIAFLSSRKSLSPEPLGDPKNVKIKSGYVYSSTEPFDKDNTYREQHQRFYDFELEQQPGLSPLKTSKEKPTIDYGISASALEPQKAIYYTPTRFTITGKNVHRTTVFFIEGCAKEDMKILTQVFDKLVIECFIQPLPKTDLSSFQGKTFQHLFLFKTHSRFSAEGKSMLSNEEDRKNIVLSGYLEVSADFEERIESIEPKQAIIGRETIFTVKGNNLPYSDASREKPLVFLDHCRGSGKNGAIEIIPKSYTPYSFDVRCTPEFNMTPQKKRDPFDLKKVHEVCDSILEKAWTEWEKNAALEKCYESKNRVVKRSLWGYFDTFFKTLKSRKLQVKKKTQEVRFISALYDQIRREESFQFQHSREDGSYESSGNPLVQKVLLGSITRANRNQTITVMGSALPKSLDLSSDDCDQIAITFGSSERFTFVCLLKKIAVQNLSFVDLARNHELYRLTTEVREIYDVRAAHSDQGIDIEVSGVNLNVDVLVTSPECKEMEQLREPTTSELFFRCYSEAGEFSKPASLQLKIMTKDGVLLFDESVLLKEIHLPKADDRSPPEADEDQKEKKITLGSSDWLQLECLSHDQGEVMLGECDLISPFIRQGNFKASYDNAEKKVVVEGHLEGRLFSGADNFLQSIAGVTITPFSGSALIAVDLNERSLLMNGDLKTFGIDLSQALGFPFDFSVSEYQGDLLLGAPTFDRAKSREKSRVVVGIGQPVVESSERIKASTKTLKKKIEQQIRGMNRALKKKAVEIAEYLSASVEHRFLKKVVSAGTLEILKGLSIVPDSIAFYDNFDFTASGKLKSEPFRPKWWPKTQGWNSEIDLAHLFIDLRAHEGMLELQGDILNGLTLFNNEILRADRGLINGELLIDLSKDSGRFDLETIEVRLPLDLARVSANAHFTHLFDPENLTASGIINSELQLKGIELAKAGASFRYDPNAQYSVGDQKVFGLLRLDLQAKLIALLLSGKAVFTLPGDQAAMDVGGSLDLSFLGKEKRLGDILGRARMNQQMFLGCFNSQTGAISFSIPLVNKTIDLQGGLSIEVKIVLSENSLPTLQFLGLSGQGSEQTRIGFQYDHSRNFLQAFSSFKKACEDVPGQEFLNDILGARETPSHLVRSMASSSLVASRELTPEILSEVFHSEQSAKWNVKGWKYVMPSAGVSVLILDREGNEISVKEGDYGVPGLWTFENPDLFILYDEQSFLKSGYHFTIKHGEKKDQEIEVLSFENPQDITTRTFSIPSFSEVTVDLDIRNVEKTNTIMIDGVSREPLSVERRPLDQNDLQVQSKVTSQALPKTSSDGSKKSFPDVRSPLLEEALSFLKKKGIINGYPDGTFKPEQTINRAEALKIIVAALSEHQATNYSSSPSDLRVEDQLQATSYPDVHPQDWFFSVVSLAEERGIIQGYPDGTFKPEQTVNRAEFIKMAIGSLQSYQRPNSFQPAREQYSDLEAEWYMPYVTFGVMNNLLDKGKKLSPEKGMTRGDAALLLYRIHQWLENN